MYIATQVTYFEATHQFNAKHSEKIIELRLEIANEKIYIKRRLLEIKLEWVRDEIHNTGVYLAELQERLNAKIFRKRNVTTQIKNICKFKKQRRNSVENTNTIVF